MKATVEFLCGAYEITGIRKAERDLTIDNGKETYETFYLYSLSSKTYKTLKNAIRAIEKRGIEYIALDNINVVCGLD